MFHQPSNIKAIFLCFSLCSLGCAETPNSIPFEPCQENYQNCSLAHDAGDCPKDWGCDHEIDEEHDTYRVAFKGNLASIETYEKGYIGNFERGCRTLSKTEKGADVDCLIIDTTPGTPLQVEVAPYVGQKSTPMASLRNPLGALLAYGLPDRNGRSQLSFLAPNSKFYICTEEYSNYYLNYQTTCDTHAITGGDTYHYYLTVRTTQQTIQDLGLLNETHKVQGTFSESGQVHYYKVQTPSSASLKIRLRSTRQFEHDMPIASPIKNATNSQDVNAFSWGLTGNQPKRYIQRIDDANQFEYLVEKQFATCTTSECVYVLAVTDYEARMNYTYALELIARAN